jgi:hypothetical protein
MLPQPRVVVVLRLGDEPGDGIPSGAERMFVCLSQNNAWRGKMVSTL